MMRPRKHSFGHGLRGALTEPLRRFQLSLLILFLLIVARANVEASESKLRRAGADRVVTPDIIGGHRLALALLRPAVHDFLSGIFSFGYDVDVDLGQLTVPAGSPLAEGRRSPAAISAASAT
jgi:voltage-gated potassium channel